MTREEAIKILTMLRCQDTRVEADAYEQALEMAIKALSQEPTEKPMTVDEMEREYEKSKALFHKIVECDDAISREAVLEICIKEWDIDLLLERIEQLPSVTQKSGKWKHEQFPNFKVAWFCNKCGGGTYHKTNYCPNCGARMESDKE